jgi:hypothetical protein
LAERRTAERTKKPRTAYVHESAGLAAFRQGGQPNFHPDGKSAALCTGSESCPYLKEDSKQPAAERAKDSADIAGKGDAADKKGTRDPLEKYLRDRFARRFRRNPDPALLARLATILDTRGASVDNFIAHVNEKDQRDPIQSYGLLFALAGECSKVDASPAEVDVVLTPSQMEHHAIFRRGHRGKER